MLSQERIFALAAAVAVATASFALTAAPAMAEPLVVTAPRHDDRSVRHVRYADLNLASEDGERALVKRVGGAVKQVCGEVREVTEYDGRRYVDCQAIAWNSAMPQIDAVVNQSRGLASAGTVLTGATIVVAF